MKTATDVKVLVVEDDPFFTRILQKRLSAEGYQVFTAGDGRAGMKAIVQHEPDLVISDWMMPEVDGLELCQSVKTGLREAAPYFILLTAKGEISDKLLALETGADDYLVKPCDQVELVARVRAGIRVVALTQSLRRTVADLRAGNRPEDPPIRYCESCRRLDEGTGWMDLPFFLRERIGRTVVPDACPECADKAATDGRKVA
jgi:DNA-binding response OmpR family regulator